MLEQDSIIISYEKNLKDKEKLLQKKQQELEEAKIKSEELNVKIEEALWELVERENEINKYEIIRTDVSN